MPDDPLQTAATSTTATPPDLGPTDPPTRSRPGASGQPIWRRLWELGTDAAKYSAAASTVIAVVSAAVVIGQSALRPHRIDLDTISVPKELADSGYSERVVTQMMADEIQAIIGGANTTMRHASVATSATESTVVTPDSASWADIVAASLRSHLPEDWTNRISGEFTQPGGPGGRMYLRLRHNGRPFFSSPPVGDQGAADSVTALIEQGAFKTVARVQPYFAASWLYELSQQGKRTTDDAIAECDHIIDSRPSADENVARAYNLKGLVAKDQGDFGLARTYYEEALRIKPRFVVSIFNLAYLHERSADAYRRSGDVRRASEEDDRAIEGYREVTRLEPWNPVVAFAYNNLGAIWDRQGKPARAIAAYREAIRIDPAYSLAHSNVAAILRRQNRLDEAAEQYLEAIRLNPAAASARYDLGSIRENERKIDDASYEYLEAVAANPTFAAAHHRLGTMRDRQGRLDTALSEYRLAVYFAPANIEAWHDLEALLRKLSPKAAGALRPALLHEACMDVVEGARLAPQNQTFQGDMNDLDAEMAPAHCPPVIASGGGP